MQSNAGCPAVEVDTRLKDPYHISLLKPISYMKSTTMSVPDTKRKSEAAASPSLQRGIALLEHLARHSHGCTLSALSEELTIPQASLLRIGKALEELGYVTRDVTTKKYYLTNRFLQLIPPSVQDRPLMECAIGPMRELRDMTSETTQLCCLIDREIVILEQMLARHAFKYSAEIGARAPCYSCAPGKAIAAFLPDNERDDLVNRIHFKRFTPHTITSRRAFLNELDLIRQRGYAIDHEEGLVGIRCIAAPILDRNGIGIAAFTITGPAERIPQDEYESLGQVVRSRADAATFAYNR